MVKMILAISLLCVVHVSMAQDGSVIANMKTSNVDVKVQESFDGLWEVIEVKAGDRIVTPVAKWFQINKDGTAQGGNGWLQNASDTWTFDNVNKEILFTTNGVPDPYGAFQLKVQDNKMSWSRIEEGMNLVVKLIRVEKKPLGPWDKIVGTWETTGVSQEPRLLRFNWTRRFVDRDNKVQSIGTWHIDAHRPILTLYYDNNPSVNKTVWNMEIDGDQMTWVNREDDSQKIVLTRRDQNDN